MSHAHHRRVEGPTGSQRFATALSLVTAPPRSAAVEFCGVTKRYGNTVAVDNLSFHVEAGEFFSLLGPSGCGKTTTLRVLAGFETPDAGTILINGDEANHRRPYERPLAMVFQNYALFPHLSVARNVAFGLEQRKRPAEEIERRVRDALALVQLDPVTYARRMPAELSGGQRQRVALARALVLEPAILLLDEPLGALDLKLRKEMQLELKRLNHETGTTFVYVTHDQEEALAMSDRIAVMNHARIAQIGTPAAVYEDPRTRFVADFIGEANFLGGKAERRQGDRNDGGQAAGRPGGQHDSHVAAGLSPAVFWEVVHSTGARFVVADHPTICEGSHVEIAIRPEWHDLWRDGEAPAGENTLPATVSDIVYLGETIHVLVELSDRTSFRVALRNEGQLLKPLPWQRGDRCVVGWRPEDCQVLEAE